MGNAKSMLFVSYIPKSFHREKETRFARLPSRSQSQEVATIALVIGVVSTIKLVVAIFGTGRRFSTNGVFSREESLESLIRDQKSMGMAMFKRTFARTIPDNLRAPHMKMWGFDAKRA